MPEFGLVYDLRFPNPSGQRRAVLYETCVEQCRWADDAGFGRISLREHHGTDDGYLPSPLVLAGGIAARTRSVTLLLQALVMTLHHPLRLAEDLAVLDLMSSGRVAVVAGAGYVEAEHEMFGQRYDQRPRLMERAIDALRRAWTGESFEFEGRMVRVTPTPFQMGGPPLVLGGASRAAARRAARIADGFLPVRGRFYDDYRAEVVALGGNDPGPPRPTGPLFIYVAEDPDAAWYDIAPFCMHDTNAYGRLARAAGVDTGFVEFDDPQALRSSGEYPILTPEECVALCNDLGDDGVLVIPPLVGGMDPDLSWRSLELLESQVLPHVNMTKTAPNGYRTSVPISVAGRELES